MYTVYRVVDGFKQFIQAFADEEEWADMIDVIYVVEETL